MDPADDIMDRTFPETIYCFTKADNVPIQKCIDNCGAPELRPACWAARGIAHSFDAVPERELPVVWTVDGKPATEAEVDAAMERYAK